MLLSPRQLIDANFTPALVSLFGTSPCIKIREQALWVLANIIGECSEFRDAILRQGLLQPLLALVDEDSPLNFQRIITWTLVNIVRSRDRQLPVTDIDQLVRALCKMLSKFDNATQVDALWGLIYVAECGGDYVDAVCRSNAIELALNRVFKTNSWRRLQSTALTLLGNITVGSDANTQELLDRGLLLVLTGVLHN